MSYDASLLSRTPIERRAVVDTVRKWAAATPCCAFSEYERSAQVVYENPETLVVAIIDLALDDSDVDPESEPPQRGMHDTGCAVHLNYLRPTFFANELTPVVASLARTIPAVIHDMQDDTILDADDFERQNPYLRHLTNINASFVRSEKADRRPKQVDPDLLRELWLHNFARAELQSALGDGIFVPSIKLAEMRDQPRPTTMFVWGRAIPSAFRRSGYVLLVREKRGFWKTSNEYRLAPYDAFRSAAADVISPLNDYDGAYAVNDKSQTKLDAAFDRLFASLPKIDDLKAAMPNMFGDFMGIVDAVE